MAWLTILHTSKHQTLSRPCHYWLTCTNNHFFWLNIDIIVTVIRITLILLHLVEICSWLEGLAVELWHRLRNSTDTYTSETTERITEEAVGVCSTWSAGKKTIAVVLGFAFEYTAGGRVPALSLVFLLLTHRTVVLQPIFHSLFLPFRKLIRRKWGHKPYILERHSSLWHWIVWRWMCKVFHPPLRYSLQRRIPLI